MQLRIDLPAMSISSKDIKLLWGRAAGRCSAPGCRLDLTPLLEKSGPVVLGEMAHVIGRKPGSARSDDTVGEDNSYDNLILLCPNHHTMVDKAQADYPIEVLRKWKVEWEQQVSSIDGSIKGREELFKSINSLLIANHTAFLEWGPESERAQDNPQSEQAATTWQLRRLSVIVPNNRSIINLLRTNDALLEHDERPITQRFIEHAEFYEGHCGEPKDASAYLPFPREFDDLVRRTARNG